MLQQFTHSIFQHLRIALLCEARKISNLNLNTYGCIVLMASDAWFGVAPHFVVIEKFAGEFADKQSMERRWMKGDNTNLNSRI